MKYETVLINEKEIFHLINQVYQGNIPPTFEDFDMDIHDRMTTWGLLMIGFVVLMLVVVNLMKWQNRIAFSFFKKIRPTLIERIFIILQISFDKFD